MTNARLQKRTNKIKTSLKKSGIKTLQDVLNTSVLSDDAKINYIRHRFTCYNNYLQTFYRNNEGVALRKELNNIIENVVKGKCSIIDLEAFDKDLKGRLKNVNASYEEERKLALYQADPERRILPDVQAEPCDTPNIPDLTEKEKACLQMIPFGYCRTNMTESYKIKICKAYIESIRNTWKDVFKQKLVSKDINCYLVELYLDNRSKAFYPADFTDLDFVKWTDIVKMAKEWLLEKFDGNREKCDDFMTITLPLWMKNNANIHESKILQLL